MKASIYIRVSTAEQAAEGFSLAAQQQRCTDFIKSQGWELGEVYKDDGYSAKDLNRPSMQRLIQDVKSKKFDVLVVYRLDLLSGDRARKASQIPACRSCPRCDCGRQSSPYTRLSLLLIQKKVFGPLSILAPFLLLAMLHRPPSLEYSTEPPVVCWPRAESTRPALPWIRSGTSLR